jgi:hypothetical protein
MAVGVVVVGGEIFRSFLSGERFGDSGSRRLAEGMWIGRVVNILLFASGLIFGWFWACGSAGLVSSHQVTEGGFNRAAVSDLFFFLPSSIRV